MGLNIFQYKYCFCLIAKKDANKINGRKEYGWSLKWIMWEEQLFDPPIDFITSVNAP